MESFIVTSLPGVDENIRQKLNDKLLEIGVMSLDDLQFVEEEYIKEILKPVQVKKFLHCCKNFEIIPSFPEIVSENIESTSINPQNTSDLNHKDKDHESVKSPLPVQENWAEKFMIDFASFPKEIELASLKGIIPSKPSVNEMVRTLSTQILNVTVSPGRKNLRIIANKVIKNYPGVFEDRWGEKIVGDGLTTLMKKLENCIDNRNRKKSSVEDCFENGVKKRRTQRQSYGCVQWQPVNLPDGETEEQLKIHQTWLQEEYTKVKTNEEKVSELMNICYPIQRFFINNVKCSIISVKKEWPFLLQPQYLLRHTSVLLEKDVREIFLKDIPVKGKKIYDFMKTRTMMPKVANCLRKIEAAKAEVESVRPEFIGAFHLLMAYFDEDECLLFKEKLGPDEIESDTLLTPYLVTFGCNLFTALDYAVIIDGQICSWCKDFPTAIAVLFSSYFVFNVEYNTGAALTLEFIQRCIAGINPSRGTKISKKERLKQSSITRKVVKLATKLNEFQKAFQI